MLTPEYYEKSSKRLVELYSTLENDIIRDIARRIASTNMMTGSAEWQIEVAQLLGISYDEVIKRVHVNTKLSEKKLRELFEEAGIKNLECDDEIYKKSGKTPIPFKKSKIMMEILEAGIRKTNGILKNLCLTTAINLNDITLEILNDAYMKVSTGAFDYNTVIRKTVKELSSLGITSFDYNSGRRYKLESAVRMNVLTGLQQTMGKISLERAKEMNCDLVEITAHGGARPEHAEWQGKIFSISGKHKKYKSLKDGTGYGTALGLKGVNCRHDFFPYIEGISTPTYNKCELEEYNAKNIKYNNKVYTEYEAIRLQRKIERDIRNIKREIAALEGGIKGSNNEELAQEFKFEWNKQKDKLKERQNLLVDFIKQTELRRDNSREMIANWTLNDRNKEIKRINNKEDLKQYNKYFAVLGKKSMPTFENFQKMKYNNSSEYESIKYEIKLKKHYEQVIEKGELSVLCNFEDYKYIDKQIQNNLVGLKTQQGIKINSYSLHFIDRIIGSIEQRRSGVEIEDAKNTILTSKLIKELKESIVLYGKNNQVSINPLTGNLIQTNPMKEGRKHDKNK